MDMQKWDRQGLMFATPVGHPWWRTHAQAVTPLVLGPRRWRLYVSGRDDQNRLRMVYLDVDPMDGMRELDRCFEPLLPLGEPGTFDSAGQGACSALLRQGRVYLYYVGFHLRRDVPYSISLGLATSEDGHAFTRAVPGPVIGTGPHDPGLSTVAHVVEVDDGLHAWYTSGTGWVQTPDGRLDPLYGLATARSKDGIHWTRGQTEIPPTSQYGGVTRPWTATLQGVPHLFFARRGTYHFRESSEMAYRLMQVRLAPDGQPEGEPRPVEYSRPPQPGDWDGSMQAYPAIVPLGPGYVMFYNGDGFGIGGFGWATLNL